MSENREQLKQKVEELEKELADLKQLHEENRQPAKFPRENPNPFIQVDSNGMIINVNKAGLFLLQVWNCKAGETLPGIWREIVKAVKTSGEKKEVEEVFNEQVFALTFESVIKSDYVYIFGFDITDRKRAEEALRVSEENYRTLFDTMTQGVIYINKEGFIISLNPAAEKILGATLEEFKKRSTSDDDRGIIREDGSAFPDNEHPSIQALETGKEIKNVIMGVFNPRKKDYTWIEVDAVPIFKHGEAKPYQVYAIIEDVTERLNISRSLNLTQFSIDIAPVAIFWMNREGGFTYINEQACCLLGYTAEELLNLHIWDIDPAFPSERWRIRWDEYSNGDPHSREFETVHTRKDGSVFPVEVLSKHFWFGAIEFHVSFVRDISTRKKNENTLRESEKRFRFIFEQAPIGVAQLDAATAKFTRINQKYLDIIGYEEDDLDELTFMKITHPDDLQADLENMELMKTGKISNHTTEKRYFRKDGSIVWVRLTVVPMWEPGEKPNYHIVIAEDITLKKMSDEVILKSERRLKEANATKEKFLSIIGHDLRSPFNTILGFTNILSSEYDSLDDTERKEFIEKVNISVHQAFKLLENLLNWANAQQGRIEIKKEKLNLKKLVDESITPYLSYTEKKELKVDITIPGDLFITADKYTSETIIGNLFSNAVKFTPKRGEITLNAFSKESLVEISVTDTGVGMNEETRNKLFRIEEFNSELGTEKEKGTGLGLILCKEFIEKNDGTIRVESEVGKGSRFVISFPG